MPTKQLKPKAKLNHFNITVAPQRLQQLLQVLLLLMLASSVALSFSAPAAAWLALAVFAIAAL
ncbi:MAG: hypothetical protein V1817_00950, partial [Candidatus Micrarchaeota archaeon]